MSVEMINAKDRIPSNVLSNGAVRYGVYDENGALVRYEYIKREDEPVEAGTNVNKVLFDTIDNNFLTTLSRMGLIDKYNVPTITQEIISGTNDIIPKEWETVTEYLKYKNGNIILEGSSIYGTRPENYSADKAVDGDTTTYWQGLRNEGSNKLTIDFGVKYKITKMKTYISCYGSNFGTCYIEGSTDNNTWNELYSFQSKQTGITEITLNNPDYYRYYRIRHNTGGTSNASYIYEWQVSEWSKINNILNLNNDIENYETNQRVLLKIDSIEQNNLNYININNLGNKLINDFEGSTGLYELIYNGESFDAISYKNEIDKIKQAIVDLGGVL